MVVALCAIQAVDARTHHRAPKRTVPAVEMKSGAVIPDKQSRDPADIALDRKIKGICRGC
jgi:hypothetical protein